MPVYKQYNYKKIRDCNSCKYYQERCRHPCPNDHNCNFKTIKSWSHRYFFKTSLNGRAFLKRGFKTREEAREAETDYRRKLNKEIVSEEDLPKYYDLLNEYGETFKRMKITYYRQVKTRIQNMYSKYFPNIPVNKLLAVDAELARSKIDKEKIKTITKNDKLDFLKRFFIYVKEMYNFDFKPVFLLFEFRDYSIKREQQKERIVEFDEFYNIYKVSNAYYKLAFLTMFIYGVRITELLGLKVNAFDFQKNTVEFYQAVTIKGKKGWELVTPKTRSSERLRSMPKIYSDMIKNHINEHDLKQNDFIFYRYKNKKEEEDHSIPLHENMFRRQANKICKQYNEYFHPHMLRTSIITHLSEKGVSIDEIANYIGHESENVTKEYYLKESKKKEEIVNQAIDTMLKKIL